MPDIMRYDPAPKTVGVQVIHRETGNEVEEPLYFDETRPLEEVIKYLIEYIMEGNEMTEQEVRATYRFRIEL